MMLSGETLREVVRAIPPSWLRSRRWFAGKSRELHSLDLFDHALISDDPLVALTLIDVQYTDGPAELYAVPLLFEGTGAPILTFKSSPVSDALEDRVYHEMLPRLIAQRVQCGPVRFEPLIDLPEEAGEAKPLGLEQSNTSIRYGRSWILKSFRKLAFGENRDLEVGRFLTLEAGFPHTPQVGGCIIYEGRQTATLGVLQRFVENEGDGWAYVRAHLQAEDAPNAPDDVYWAQDGLPQRDAALLDDIELLGRISGEMHRALGSRTDLPTFAPEPVSEADVQAWVADLEAQRAAALTAAKATKGQVGEEARQLLAKRSFGAIQLEAHALRKIQIHGDYHLGQVLRTADGFSIIDFEGEPARPLEERRAKQPALRDVAGMLRSIDYVGRSMSREGWAKAAGGRFLEGWQRTSGEALEPRLLCLFELTKAYYELAYELNNRPDWAAIPLRGIASLLAEAA